MGNRLADMAAHADGPGAAGSPGGKGKKNKKNKKKKKKKKAKPGEPPVERPNFGPVGESSVLARARDFLPRMRMANEAIAHMPPEAINMEAVGDDEEHIDMTIMVDPEAIEERRADLAEQRRAATGIPLIVDLSPMDEN